MRGIRLEPQCHHEARPASASTMAAPMTYPVRVCIVYDLFMRAITYLYLDITFVEGLDVF
jgi:hypothetical protein